tara:strand:- start:275 stop:649 length:375 start_codon:yes stop_codon:yes gene_type:complete
MRAILIDPKHKQIMQIDYNGDYKTIYEHLSFYPNAEGMTHKPRAFDIVRIPVGNDGIYVDDEGLFVPNEDKHWFTYRYNAHEMHQNIPLVNRGLIIGCDENGDSVDCDSTVDSIKSQITWGIVR